MKYARTFSFCVVLVCLISSGIFSTQAIADFKMGKELKAADEVKKLSVTITVGKDGGDLEEGVALDLGLGFPLLLEPVGRDTSQALEFGAVPQETTAGKKIAAGERGKFTFTLKTDATVQNQAADQASGQDQSTGTDQAANQNQANGQDQTTGQDQFDTTSQLLDGIRVSDISRIGFAGLGKKKWTLAGYEILVNDKLLASNDKVDAKLDDAVTAAQFGIADLNLKITPLEKIVSDLAALEDSKLATKADLKQLAETKKKLQPLEEKLKLLKAQSLGKYPWFIDDKFVPLGQEGAEIKSAKVTLLTQKHSGAGTKNRVYFRTGGHKYQLSSYNNPLSSSLGPQVFDLDLLAGPLTAGNVRGFALGMLANDQPYGDAPDRWHPERILVELDGSIVYDSDEYPYDRKSLDAIRIIPPVHLDKDGNAVSNKNHTLREVYVWESGKAMGLDETDNSPLPLPPKDDPTYPDVEPGLPDDSTLPDDTQPDDSTMQDNSNLPDDGTLPDDGSYPDDEYFPGEDEWCPDDSGDWIPGGGGDWIPGGGGDWIPGGDGGGWIPGGGGGWWPPIWPPIWPPGGSNPPPIGPVPQVKDARITAGWRMNDTFTVEWDFDGDESQVTQYRIMLYTFKPELANPIQMLLDTKTEAAGTRTTTVNIAGPLAGLDYVIAQVTADFSDGTLHADLTPAHAVFPSNTDPLLDRLHIVPMQYEYQPAGPPLPPPFPSGPIAAGSDPGGARAAWTFGLEQSHIDHEFDASNMAWNVALRPAGGDVWMNFPLSVAVAVPPGPAKKMRFVSYVGFAQGKGAWNTADFGMTCIITKLGGLPGAVLMMPINVANPIAGVPQPMKKIEFVFDSSAYGGPGVYLLQFRVNAAGGTLDVDHPPAFFGARFVPEP
ncbi:MAG: hypothetical protein JXM70_19620 [Pirellulales bacterium]|nr:hypothetical protein [Pirellulales bacterium]